ncbi:MAG: M23 family metallopeptidase [Candidatus Zixiibacteriota bacterium]
MLKVDLSKKPRSKFTKWTNRIFKGRRGACIAISVLLIFLGIRFLIDNKQSNSIIQDAQAATYISNTCLYKGAIEKDQSLFIALTDAGISPKHVDHIQRGLRGTFDLRKLRPGDYYEISYSMCGDTMRFHLDRSLWEKYDVVKTPDTLYSIKDSTSLEYNLVAAQGVIENTLWQSMRNAGMSPKLIMRFTDLLSYDFDFVTDTRNGQQFRVLYEQFSYDGEPIRLGRVVFVQYQELSGKKHEACFYKDPDGKEGYYNLKGKSAKRSLLKTPLKYSRISSGYSNARFHPILKKYRPHHGVDYAAPSGTPIVASGRGKVIVCGFIKGYGHTVRIQHANNIQTWYHHLSRYASGIKSGKWVNEGQVIGYVGSTGLSTGPHLDYRVKVGGKFVNPLKYAFPSGPPVPSKYMEDYLGRAQKIEHLTLELSHLHKVRIASNDNKKQEILDENAN